MKKIVGNNSANYPDIRNINSLPFRRYEFRRVHDIFNVATYIQYKLFRTINRYSKNLHFDCGLPKVDIYHFFNTISLNRTPWVVTYESGFPRWNHDSKMGAKLLASEFCRKIIAISHCANNILNLYLRSV